MRSDGCDITFVSLRSEITLETSSRVRKTLAPLLERAGHVIVDLRGATVDSSGLGVLLSLQRRLELQERRLALVTSEAHFFALLERVGAQGSLAVFAKVDDAMEFVQREECALAA